MANINVNLPALDVSQALSVFPELDAETVVNLTNSGEATLQMKQAVGDWASIIQVQADSLDAVETATDDVKYKINGDWPSDYDDNSGNNEVHFRLASFAGGATGHTTLGGHTTSATTLKDAMRFNISEDFVGTKDAFDIFSNEALLYADFDTQANTLQAAVETKWGDLKAANTESLGAGILSNATASGSNPAKTIVQAILNSDSHQSKGTLADNLANRADTAEGRALFVNVPLVAGDKLNFNITFAAATREDGTQDVPQSGLSSAADGAQDHIFHVEIELVA